MTPVLKAGAVYFAIVFAAGFVLGTARVLFLLPFLGETAAVLVEVPIMLSISWIVSRWITGRFDIPAELPARLLMGAVAFALLIGAELVLSNVVFGRTWPDIVVGYGSPAGLLGLSAQVIFALLPAGQALGTHHDR